jgi:hypothetical protein
MAHSLQIAVLVNSFCSLVIPYNRFRYGADDTSGRHGDPLRELRGLPVKFPLQGKSPQENRHLRWRSRPGNNEEKITKIVVPAKGPAGRKD